MESKSFAVNGVKFNVAVERQEDGKLGCIWLSTWDISKPKSELIDKRVLYDHLTA